MKYKNEIVLKLNVFFLLLFATLFFSCHSTEEKTDSAFENAKISKEFSDDSLEMETESELAPLLATQPIKRVEVNPWKNYLMEIEKEIEVNERAIADLRVAFGSDLREFKKISSLEKNNQELKRRLTEFNLEAEENLARFKSDLKTDMIELEKELNELKNKVE